MKNIQLMILPSKSPINKTIKCGNDVKLEEVLVRRMLDQEKEDTTASNTNNFNTVSTPVNAASASRTSNDAGPSSVPLGRSFPLNVNDLLDDPSCLI
ncbi:hypothetical protein Tco_0005626 [Tanacetum coccineum]